MITQNKDKDSDSSNELNIKKKKGYFQVGVSEIQRIVASGGNHIDVMAYLILCGGVNGKKSQRVTTHGVKSISSRAGVSYRVAQHSIDWLKNNQFIEPACIDIEKTTICKKFRERWIITDTDPDTGISRGFLDDYDIKSKPTLHRLSCNTGVTEDCGRSQSLIDAILVFLYLIREQDFGEWGGVHPRCWHQVFSPINESDELPSPIIKIGNSAFSLMNIENTQGVMIDISFVKDVIRNSASESESINRFRSALATLQRLQFTYRCLSIWFGNPTEITGDRLATPLGTLYVNDAWARDYDIQAQNEVNRIAWKTGTVPTNEIEFDETGSPLYVGTGRFRIIVKSNHSQAIRVIGQIRVRNWPSNSENVIGRNKLNDLTIAYMNSLSHLKEFSIS